MTDAQIMELVKNGQLNYLSEIFERYAGRIQNYFYQMTADRFISEDLTQNVFEAILRSRHNYKEEGSFQYWLFRIAKNVLTDHFRSKKYRNNVRLGEIDVPDNGIKYPDEDLSHNSKRLSKALNLLKSEHREIIILTRFENLTYKEVSEIIGISETGVKARVFRAMKSLRRAYFQNASAHE